MSEIPNQRRYSTEQNLSQNIYKSLYAKYIQKRGILSFKEIRNTIYKVARKYDVVLQTHFYERT